VQSGERPADETDLGVRDDVDGELSKELGVVALRREARNVGGTPPSLSSLLTKTFAYSESAPPGAD
jgi:hypothetical protein